MLELPSDPVRVSTSLPTASPSSCSAAALVADSWLSVKRESSVGCKSPSSWRDSWGSRRMVRIQIRREEGATRGARWDIVHSRDCSLTPKLARLCPGNSTTDCHTLVCIVTLSQSCERMISSVDALALGPGCSRKVLSTTSIAELIKHCYCCTTSRNWKNFIFVNIWFGADLDTEIERQQHCEITATVE